MAGDDALATDIAVAKAMNFNPSRIGYLKLAIKEKIGNIDSLNAIENSVRLEVGKKEFPKQNYLFQKLS